MKTIPGLFFFLLRLAKDRRARSHRLLARLLRDEEGAWLISMTIMLPVLIGVAGLGTEGGMLFYQHRSLQSAADAAAYSAAIALLLRLQPCIPTTHVRQLRRRRKPSLRVMASPSAQARIRPM